MNKLFLNMEIILLFIMFTVIIYFTPYYKQQELVMNFFFFFMDLNSITNIKYLTYSLMISYIIQA